MSGLSFCRGRSGGFLTPFHLTCGGLCVCLRVLDPGRLSPVSRVGSFLLGRATSHPALFARTSPPPLFSAASLPFRRVPFLVTATHNLRRREGGISGLSAVSRLVPNLPVMGNERSSLLHWHCTLETKVSAFLWFVNRVVVVVCYVNSFPNPSIRYLSRADWKGRDDSYRLGLVHSRPLDKRAIQIGTATL